MARCPNCTASIPWDALQCPACIAVFSDEAQWRLEPESADETAGAQVARNRSQWLPVAVFTVVVLLLIIGATGSAQRAFATFALVGGAAICGGMLVLVLRIGGRTRVEGAGVIVIGLAFAIIGIGGYRSVSEDLAQRRPSPTHSTTLEYNTSRSGAGYKFIELLGWNVEECRNYCGNDPGCAAWTLHEKRPPAMRRPGGGRTTSAYCELMANVPKPREDQCCASGVKFMK